MMLIDRVMMILLLWHRSTTGHLLKLSTVHSNDSIIVTTSTSLQSDPVKTLGLVSQLMEGLLYNDVHIPQCC